jgi:integrase
MISIVSFTPLQKLSLEAPSIEPIDLGKARLPVGFPIPWDRDAGKTIEPLTLFLWDRYVRSGGFVENSASACAADLVDFWGFLSNSLIDWNQVSRTDLEAYRDGMIYGISPKTHRPYSEQTIRRRMIHVLAFYSHSYAKGWVSQDLDVREVRESFSRIDRDALAHTRSGKSVRSRSTLIPRQNRGSHDVVRAMRMDEYKRLAHYLGPLPSGHEEGDGRPVRDRLWAELCLLTGMRPDEPSHKTHPVTVHQILNLSTKNPDDPLGISYLQVAGKGRGGPKLRKVAIPNYLLSDLVWYIENERSDAVNAGRRNGVLKVNAEPASLFLNHASAKHNAGRPAQYETFQSAFARACAQANLTEQTTKVDPETGESYVEQQTRYTPHCLRHTFAIQFYLGQRKAGVAEPWKLLQAILGHANLSTTMDTYVRLVDEFSETVTNAVVDFLARLRD